MINDDRDGVGLQKAYNQGPTKARLDRDQMALGVFPNCHECQLIDFLALKKPLAIY